MRLIYLVPLLVLYEFQKNLIFGNINISGNIPLGAVTLIFFEIFLLFFAFWHNSDHLFSYKS